MGRTIFMVDSEGKSFAFLGVLARHPILLMEKPRMEFLTTRIRNRRPTSQVKL